MAKKQYRCDPRSIEHNLWADGTIVYNNSVNKFWDNRFFKERFSDNALEEFVITANAIIEEGE